MDLIWWILPGISGVVGLFMVFAGFAKVFRVKVFAGLMRLAFGSGFIGLGGVIAFAGLNLQTYKRLVHEQDVATLEFAAAEEPGKTVASLLETDAETPKDFILRGDTFLIAARVITFKPAAQVLGYDSVYRLDFLEGRPSARGAVGQVIQITVDNVSLAQNPGLDVASLAKAYGGPLGLTQRDANFGSAVYNPMAPGLKYNIVMTQQGLKARPANAATRLALGQPASDETTSDNEGTAE